VNATLALPTHGKEVTCAEAVALSRQVGALILWRSDGHVNWLKPEQDVAEILRTGR
jgi:hypothetical protein